MTLRVQVRYDDPLASCAACAGEARAREFWTAGVYELRSGTGDYLYVGRSARPMTRIAAHSRRAWWAEVARVSITLTRCPSETNALEAQRIAALRPLYNIAGTGRPAPPPDPDASAVAAGVRAEVARREKSQMVLVRDLGRSQAWWSRRLRGLVEFDIGELGEIAEYLGLSSWTAFVPGQWLDTRPDDSKPPKEPKPPNPPAPGKPPGGPKGPGR